jgi:predicted MFS family arabinose efflux permease
MGLLAVDPERDRRRLSATFAAAYGLVVVAAAIVPWFAGLPALLLLGGISLTVSNTSANSILQTTASPRLRGQAVSLYMLALRGGASLGSVLTGISVCALGVRHALVINGALAFVAHVIVGRRWCRAPIAN